MTLLLNIYSATSSAAVLSASGSSFTEPWERYKASTDGKASLTYGYNVFAINEDYSWASHSTNNHYAALNNGNGSFAGPNAGGASVSKIEVTHAGTSVSYYNYY